jgi:hypothetical protein
MTKAEREHYDKLASLGCIVCRYLGFGFSPSEIHHIRHGAGAGQKSHYSKAIPLCPNHHRLGGHGIALHAGRRTFEQNVGKTEVELLELTTQYLEAI